MNGPSKHKFDGPARTNTKPEKQSSWCRGCRGAQSAINTCFKSYWTVTKKTRFHQTHRHNKSIKILFQIKYSQNENAQNPFIYKSIPLVLTS